MQIVTADAFGRTDGAMFNFLSQHLQSSKLPIVIVSWMEDFKYNNAIEGIGDYVLVCVSEYGWDFKIKETHIWGKNTETVANRYAGEEWQKFDQFVRSNPPIITFKRELLKKDVAPNLYPIDYPCLLQEYPIDNKELFNSRPIDFFNYWGRSNENRVRLHYELLQYGFQKGFQVCDNMYYINGYLANESGRNGVTLWIPHYARISIDTLMSINLASKLCYSLPGAGFKCFRSAEAPVNSVMVMWENDFAWAYDWNSSNCILCNPGEETKVLDEWLSESKKDELYEIYRNGVENCKKYMASNYANDYLLPIINNA